MADDPNSLIAVLFAVQQEASPFQRMFPPLGVGKINGRQVVAIRAGVGHRIVEAKAREFIARFSPSLLVMAGVAGALDPALSVGDLIIADRVLTPDGVLTPTVISNGSGFAPAARTGTLLCADRVLITAAEKRAAFSPNSPTAQRPNDPPLAVEMESAGLARVAMEHDIPWGAVRAISDTADDSLPLDFNRLRSADGDLPTSRVALAAMTHPLAIPGLIRLGKNTTVAANALAGFLHAWIQRGLPIR